MYNTSSMHMGERASKLSSNCSNRGFSQPATLPTLPDQFPYRDSVYSFQSQTNGTLIDSYTKETTRTRYSAKLTALQRNDFRPYHSSLQRTRPR